MAAFTLVEMSIVVVIAGIIVMALLPALLDIRRSAQLTATQTNLQTLMRATAAYTLANGCVPCPTPGDKIASRASEIGKVGTAGNRACAVCAQADGIPPFASLGIDPSVAKDGWGRWITMHIDTALTNPQPCTADEISAGLAGCGKSDATRSGLCRANQSRAGRITVNLAPGTAEAAVIFVSHGANGSGAYRTQAKTIRDRLDVAPCNVTSGKFEGCNAKPSVNSPDNEFWLAPRGSNFDDIITYADRNALVSLFGMAACTTPW